MSSNNKKNINLSIVILTYNSENVIDQCIESVLNNVNINITEIIIVDNNSQDHTIETLEKYGHKIRFINNKKNTGFARGTNKALRKCIGDKILILNPDTIVLKNSIQKLLNCQERSKADIVGGKAYKADRTVHGSYVRFPDFLTILFDFTNLRKIIPGDFIHKHHYYLNEKPPTRPKEVDAVSGAFMLVRKEVLKRIGFFDEHFFLYLEDIDFCIRAQKAGLKVVYCPKSTILHIGGVSSPNKYRINIKAWSDSRRYYVFKHFSFFQNVFLQPALFFDDLCSLIWRESRK